MNVRFNFLLILLVLSRFFCAGASGKSAGLAEATKQDAVSTPAPTGSKVSESPTDSPTPAETPKISHGSIEPPFGLRWGESKEEVKNQLAKAGVQILKRPKVDDREVLAIEGIRQPSLLQAIAYFDTQKKLAEVELQYGDSAWTFDAYKAFVISVTRRLQAYYGEPTVLERDRRPEGDRVETIAGYQWQQGDSSGVLLFFFSVEQGKNSYTTVSIHYRVELPEAPATPDKSPISDNSGKTG